ncbi:MAG: hypothetical protein KBG48_01315 [Kofleriaceae bacterium]|nr:hypothetical protein [Kofleriaceae bacterium]MBP9165984.1 hypothetical protein [Kofleriaceae bacterium]MBP9857337.1 hypothetical protein [Kofleriaceae bacterium]
MIEPGARRLAVALALAAALASGASAAPLAAIAAAPDPWAATLLGPSGQVWRPDGQGGWDQVGAGGAAADVRGAVVADGPVVVGKAAPMYRHDRDAWHAVRLGERGKTLAGTGPRAAVAIGRQVFVWSGQRWVRAATAPAPITALWAASDKQLYVAGADVVWRLRGKALVPHATVAVRGFATGVGAGAWAVTADGALYDVARRSAVPVAGSAGPIAIEQVTDADGEPWVLGRRGAARVLARRERGAWLELPGPALADDDLVVGFAASRARGPLVVAASGAVWRHDATGTWAAAPLRVMAEPTRPGPGPARMPR